ncbi:MAG: MmcQ/YjbR family DNA-binding protein [Flavipsychrobacter sp.]|nr:MmcQ/YjbR family DNA-binding protein [Flavipsychrobacter sp.]
MNIDEIREYCLSKPDVEECFPFDEETLVFKVKGKMFLLTGLNESPVHINVKCDPDRAIELRDEHAQVLPGYHMNKKHWNTIEIDGLLGARFVKQQIDNSYDLVRASLPKKYRY